ncbi:hypothetical protein H7Y21_02845 [Arenimonas sp.]|nr:hypothetical protein [Candidatus Parcubacteria bacterium]
MNTTPFTLENISLMSTIMINLILIIIIFLIKNKTKNNYLFIGFISSIFIWTISTFVFLNAKPDLTVFAAKIFYISGCIIPVFIILFTVTFPKQKLNYSKLKLFLFILFPTLICISVTLPGTVVRDVVLNNGYKTILFGPLYKLLFAYIVCYFSLVFIVIYKKHRELKGIEKKQVEIIFSSICFATFSALFVSLIMPTLGNFSLFWAGPFFSGYMLLTITYAIIRYSFFDIKLVATEFLTLAIWLLLFVKIFFDDRTKDIVTDSVVLFLVIIGGILIIKSIQKEKILIEKLEMTNIDLQELDKKKSEFMSLATHQLRTPLTAMKGYSSMILDGTFGEENNPDIKDSVSKILRSTEDLAMIVEDYLNISQIEQGRMQYNFADIDVGLVVKNIFNSVKSTANRAGLIFRLNYDENKKYIVHGDEGKIKQVVLNVIDNAVKYTPKGEIDIFIRETNENKVLIEVKDTGVGIKSEVLPSLFHKFVRAPDASKVNILGTGLGLYVAGEILKAHSGRAWVESKGEGKGSVFYIELTLA